MLAGILQRTLIDMVFVKIRPSLQKPVQTAPRTDPSLQNWTQRLFSLFFFSLSLILPFHYPLLQSLTDSHLGSCCRKFWLPTQYHFTPLFLLKKKLIMLGEVTRPAKLHFLDSLLERMPANEKLLDSISGKGVWLRWRSCFCSCLSLPFC